jgi:hypothetical protein
MGELGNKMMRGSGTGKERVGEQKLLNRGKLVSAFGGGSVSKKRKKKARRSKHGVY